MTLVAVSRALLAKIEGFKKRMGWTFKWVPSFENDCNRDFNVSFTPEELEGDVFHNFESASSRATRRRA